MYVNINSKYDQSNLLWKKKYSSNECPSSLKARGLDKHGLYLYMINI